MQRFDRSLLEILVCPISRGPLTYDEARQLLISEKAELAYPIRDGIPILLADEAVPMKETKGASEIDAG